MGRSKEPVPEGSTWAYSSGHHRCPDNSAAHNTLALVPRSPGEPLSPQWAFPVGPVKALEPSAPRLCSERPGSTLPAADGPQRDTQFNWRLQVQ